MENREPLPFPADAGFELCEEIGRGGSGVVYAVRWQENKVALKVPQTDLGERDRMHFLREAALLQKAAHPGVVEVLDAGTLSDGRPYLVMPLLRGESLAAYIARRGKLPVDEALGLFLPLADAVAHLHGMELAHRDIKPENVFYLEADRRLLLLDFGIARETDKPPSTTTRANIVRGTPATMAPERFFGARATATSDAYELALVLYAMLAGALPWGDSTDASERLSPKPPSEMGAVVPEAVERAILEALSTRPERRPTVRALIDRLSNQTSDSPAPRTTLATKPPDAPPPNADEKRVTKASSIAPPNRTTGKNIDTSARKRSALPLVGAVTLALGVGALVARAWPTATSIQDLTQTARPISEASAAPAPTLSAESAPTSSATVAIEKETASPPAQSVPHASRTGRTRAAPPPPGPACHDLIVFTCAHNTAMSEHLCAKLKAGTLDESEMTMDEARCRDELTRLRKLETAAPPKDAESGLEWCARLRDAYCPAELRGEWWAKSLCAQGQGLYDQAKKTSGAARAAANDNCAQMLPGVTVENWRKAYAGTSPPPGWVDPQ